MKKRNSNKQIETVQQGDGCCGPTIKDANTSDEQCCEQPIDGSSCCDKSVNKEINIEKTECC